MSSTNRVWSGQSMAASLNRVRPFIVLIWVGLVIEAALGVIESGGIEAATAMTN